MMFGRRKPSCGGKSIDGRGISRIGSGVFGRQIAMQRRRPGSGRHAGLVAVGIHRIVEISGIVPKAATVKFVGVAGHRRNMVVWAATLVIAEEEDESFQEELS